MKRKNDRLEHWTQVITDKYDNAYRKFNSKTKALECALVDCDKLQKQNVLKEDDYNALGKVFETFVHKFKMEVHNG